MENGTKFNLNKTIAIWKLELLQSKNLTNDNIEELVCHIEDEIDSLKKLGLNTEEAFLIAKNRIGKTEIVVNEFEKVNKGIYFKNKILPYLKGMLVLYAFKVLYNLLVYISLVLGNIFGVADKNLTFIPIGTLLVFSSILILYIANKYKTTKLNFRKITNIPFLVVIIIIGNIGGFYFQQSILHSSMFDISVYTITHKTLFAYSTIYSAAILVFSCVVFYSLKNKNRVKITT